MVREEPSVLSPIRVAIVEDDGLQRRTLRELLLDGSESVVVGEYSRAEEALRGIPRETPDAVLMDICLPGMTGIECARRLTTLVPELKVIMITALAHPEIVRQALEAGAKGYITKPYSAESVSVAIKAACVNLTVFSINGAPCLPGPSHRPAEEPMKRAGFPLGLTPREIEIMRQVARGLSDKEIGDLLGLSTRTINCHLDHIYRKWGEHSRVGALNKFRQLYGEAGESASPAQSSGKT